MNTESGRIIMWGGLAFAGVYLLRHGLLNFAAGKSSMAGGVPALGANAMIPVGSPVPNGSGNQTAALVGAGMGFATGLLTAYNNSNSNN